MKRVMRLARRAAESRRTEELEEEVAAFRRTVEIALSEDATGSAPAALASAIGKGISGFIADTNPRPVSEVLTRTAARNHAVKLRGLIEQRSHSPSQCSDRLAAVLLKGSLATR